jgi:glutamate-ammonia-ligase adenylyltransferase
VSKVLGIAQAIDERRAKEYTARLEGRLRPGTPALAIAALLAAAYPALAPAVEASPEIAEWLASEGYHSARDRASYLGRLRARVGDAIDADVVRRELRRFARDERMRIALREALPASMGGADVDVTSRELAELAEATIEIALIEAAHAIRRFGEPRRRASARFAALGWGSRGRVERGFERPGRNTDEVSWAPGAASSMTLHDY